VAEQSAVAVFEARRRELADAIEAGESELDEEDNEVPLTRKSYTHKQKLAAVDYVLHT
jgi:hypothetical protein